MSLSSAKHFRDYLEDDQIYTFIIENKIGIKAAK